MSKSIFLSDAQHKAIQQAARKAGWIVSKGPKSELRTFVVAACIHVGNATQAKQLTLEKGHHETPPHKSRAGQGGKKKRQPTRMDAGHRTVRRSSHKKKI